MRQFSLITIHPDFVDAYRRFGVLRSAEEQGLARVRAVHLRDFAVDRHASVDDRPYGGGDGMVLRPEPLAAAIQAAAAESSVKPRVLLTSPQGRAWDQSAALQLAGSEQPLVIICGRFGGVDQRLIDRYVDEEWSLGDFVLAGGELPALAMVESILRLIPGVLGDRESAARDSFGEVFAGGLEHPLYTRPPVWEGLAVPEVLLSGDHRRIEAWKHEQAQAITKRKRPDLL